MTTVVNLARALGVLRQFYEDHAYYAEDMRREFPAADSSAMSTIDYMLLLDAIRSAQADCVANHYHRNWGIASGKGKWALKWQALESLAETLYWAVDGQNLRAWE